MSSVLHTVLGATGGVGSAVAAALQQQNLPIRVVERSKEVKGFATFKADLLDAEQAMKAVEGSSHVYLCVGVAYDIAVWRRDWPRLLQNVIDACVACNARLIFLDNMYMYGPAPLSVPFDETHPQEPVSKKGQLRKQLADTLMAAFASGKLKGLIARAADFFGPGSKNSVFYVSMLERMLKGKAPQSIAPKGVKHTYAYTMDAGRAMVMLAADETCYGQVWHLPVGGGLAAEDIAALMNKELGTDYKISFVPGFILSLLGLFMRPLRELNEMMYQFRQPYDMSWQKFKNHFPDFEVTPYDVAVRETVKSFR